MDDESPGKAPAETTEERIERAARHEDEESARLSRDASTLIGIDGLARLAHELRAPLDNALARAELLLGNALPGDSRRDATLLRDELRVTVDLADRILDLSTLRSGRAQLAHESFALDSLVAEVAEAFRPRAERKGLCIVEAIDRSPSLRVRGDALRVRQLVVNLVSNAVKFTHHGEVRVALGVLSEREDAFERAFELRVEDTGPGLAREELATLFTPFRRGASPAARRQGGAGLGLAIAAEIAALLGGGLRVESEPGSGSVFHATFWLEVDPSQPALRGVEGGIDDPTSSPERARSRSVLVVEDSEPARRLLVERLRSLGHEAIACASASEARSAIERERFEVLLSDLHLADGTGLELVACLRARDRQRGGRTRAILVSAAEIPPEARKLVDAVARKPLTIDALRAMLAVETQSREALAPAPVAPCVESSRGSHEIAGAGPECFDAERALFQLGGRPETLREIATLFLDEGPRLVLEAREALGTADAARTRRAAHTLSSSLGLFGAWSVLEIAREVEAAASCGDLAGAHPAVRGLEDGVEKLRVELVRYLERAS